jgi:hypothetical protein
MLPFAGLRSHEMMIDNFVICPIQRSWVFQELVDLHRHANPKIEESLHFGIDSGHDWHQQRKKPVQDGKCMKLPEHRECLVYSMQHWMLERWICKC